ncbi:AaceriACR213Wp [[Ashbya] aceris (nom. inval.)]|nr:AaceriACR213Wp [[Ashbya] aceris (nom. inval.)]
MAGALVALARRTRSVLLVATTALMLFYYTVENQIDMLNSYAQTEHLPQISKGSDTSAPTQADELAEPVQLVAKNRYFPLLLDTWHDVPQVPGTAEGARRRAPQYDPLHAKVELHERPARGMRGRIQAPRHQLEADDDRLRPIRDAFMHDWQQYKRLAWGHDGMQPLSAQSYDTTGLATTMILSLEMLYLVGATDDAESVLQFLGGFEFRADKMPANWNATSDPTLGALIGAYELSQEPVLLAKAVELADIILQAFNTPSGAAKAPLDLRSPLQNRHPYRRSAVANLAGVSVEFTRLTQLTRDQKYFNAIYGFYDLAAHSGDEFDLEGLVTDFVDPSGCEITTSGEIRGIKSIFQGRYIGCTLGRRLRPAADPRGRSDARGIQYYSWDGLAAWCRSLQDMSLIVTDQELSAAFKTTLKAALEAIMNNMIFRPALPEMPASPEPGEPLFVSAVRTWSYTDASTGTDVVKVMREFDMTDASCALSGVLALAGAALFVDNTNYRSTAYGIMEGCARLPQLLGAPVSHVYVDPCDAADCYFDADKKSRLLSEGQYRKQGDHNGNLDGVKLTMSGAARSAGAKKYIFVDTERSYDRDLESWDPTRPLFVNDWELLQSPEGHMIESLFYMFRLSGNPKLRLQAWENWEALVKLHTTVGAKGVADRKPTAFSNILAGEREDMLPPEWFSKSLKYLYLMFSDGSKVGNLDDWVITAKGNMFRKTI